MWAISRDERERGRNGETGEEAKSHRTAIGKCTERSRSRTCSLAEDHDDGAETKGWNRRDLVVLQMKLGKSGDDVTRQQEARINKVKRRIEELERELRLLKRDLAERLAGSSSKRFKHLRVQLTFRGQLTFSGEDPPPAQPSKPAGAVSKAVPPKRPPWGYQGQAKDIIE